MVDDWHRIVDVLAARGHGPPLAYVGFSMGAIFGAAVVPTLPTIAAAVLVVGGIPEGPWLDDPALEPLLLGAAARLGDVDLLMVNKTEDEYFPRAGVERFFEAVPGDRKRLRFWEGAHDDWPDDLLDETVGFVAERTAG